MLPRVCILRLPGELRERSSMATAPLASLETLAAPGSLLRRLPAPCPIVPVSQEYRQRHIFRAKCAERAKDCYIFESGGDSVDGKHIGFQLRRCSCLWQP
jgi:hypothetical protein